MLIPIAEKTLIDKSIQFKNDWSYCPNGWIKTFAKINDNDKKLITLSINYCKWYDKYSLLWSKKIHIKIFLDTENNLPYYEIKTMN